MNSPLTVVAYRRLLQPPHQTERDEDGDDLVASDSPLEDTNRLGALKAAVRRKRSRPAALTPLETPQHPSEMEGLDGDSSLASPCSPRALPARWRNSAAVATTLPPLEVHVLERKKLFLNPHGEAVVGVEEILQLHERSPPRLRASPLQLIAVPRKVFEEDEVALMPCHSLHYRYAPSLSVEKWKEPVRDRDKNWREDELDTILSTFGSRREALKQTKMTSGPGNMRKGTWRKLDSQRLQIKSTLPTSPSTAVAAVSTDSAVALEPRDPSLPSEVLLRSQGAMISKSYCIVTIYGIGIYGRLYSEGLADRGQGSNRFLRIDAYDPRTSRSASLRVSLADLEWVFEAHAELLAPGKKQAVLSKVVSLLYFDYPEDTEISVAASPGSAEISASPVPILCISPDEKLNEADRRRREREERLRAAEQERLRLLALLLALPRRARHRVACQLRRISGHEFTVSVYHFPAQVRNLLVVAYHPRTSRTLTLAVGVGDAATLSRVRSTPHTWTAEQHTKIALALLPGLHLRAIKSKVNGHSDEGELYRMALAVRENRHGPQGSWLALPPPAVSGSKQDAVVAKYKKDGQHELLLLLQTQLQEIENKTAATSKTLRLEISQAEASFTALQVKDAELKERIEEINSGKGVVAVAADSDRQRTHEARRGHKAARKTMKDETKALQARVAAAKRELELVNEHALVERERAQSRYDRTVDALTQRAVTATLPLWFDPRDRRPPPLASELGGIRQRTRLHRCEIRDGYLSLASGACRLDGRRHRFLMFAELPDQEQEQKQSKTMEKFQLVFYDASTSETCALRLLRLEIIALTKSQHDAQLRIPALAIANSLSVQRVTELDTSYDAARSALLALKPLKKNANKRQQLTSELAVNRRQRRELCQINAPWGHVVNALCERLRYVSATATEPVLDRCLYRATRSLVSLASGLSDDESVVDCEVSVTQHGDVIQFHARDPTADETWMLVYPDSVELVKEFAVETAIELQLHLEAIATTLLLYIDETEASATPQRKMRFEE